MKIWEEMTRLVREYETSGQTQTCFSEFKGVGFHKYDYWYRKLQREAKLPAGFHKIESGGASQVRDCNAELVYPNGVVLRLDRQEPELLSRIIGMYL
ncbi:MAG: IS66 family insertion sequence element accessory protein TnpB [Cyclobacterium sp.]|uniref:IS66 family insertion sequence element accessory protein TnpA n=1 Tax=unclassified Cyclobacterium TaxID=2615055 RepID=UPI0013D6096E|nr:IS66 family insertion sequence element accessory protein TnpB [Cyclobacterium sp. SYSU L10401]